MLKTAPFVRFIVSIFIAQLTFFTGSAGLAASDQNADIRVYNDFRLPFEPTTLVSMSEYNLSLCIFSSLFALDEASVPHSDILQSWQFDDKLKAYVFVIRDGIEWSDGQPLTTDDIVFSILRLKRVAAGFYNSVTSLLSKPSHADDLRHHPSLEIVDRKTLRVHVKGPGPDLSNRLVPVSLVRQDLVDPKTLRVSKHSASLGPYVVDEKQSTAMELRLKANERYFAKHPGMAKTIVLRPYNGMVLKADEVTKAGAWPNLILDRAFTSIESWDAIKASHASVWTRPVDRILYLYPLKKTATKGVDVNAALLALGSVLQQHRLAFEETPGAIPARSLQPKGFYLFKNISYAASADILKGHVFKIAAITRQFPSDYLKKKFGELGFRCEISLFSSVDDMAQVQESGEYDYMLMSLGAADPDPVTWLTLVLESDRKFIGDYDNYYQKQFDIIKNEHDRASRHQKLVDLVYQAGERGTYLPLAHYSSIAVGGPNIDLSQIRPSDETVDMSKIIVKSVLK